MDEVQQALKARYPQIHPLAFQRSVERAKSNGHLFDILETIPSDYPIAWNDKELKWEVTDLLQSKRFDRGGKK